MRDAEENPTPKVDKATRRVCISGEEDQWDSGIWAVGITIPQISSEKDTFEDVCMG